MSKKILVIEDDKTVRRNITLLLNEEGYTVFTARDGREGIVTAKKICPDLILCDIMMQGVDGYGVFVTLLKDPATRTIPFIYLTAKVEKEDIRRGMSLGADDYIFKPFDAEDLLNSIASRLKRIETMKADMEAPREDGSPEKYSMEDKLFVQVNNKPHLVNISAIAAILAEKQYSTLKLNDGKSYLLRKTLSNWEKMLPENKFLRIHRSTIINIDYLVRMEPWFNSGYLVYLKGMDKPFEISRRYSIKLRGRLLK